MGRIKTTFIKRITSDLIKTYGSKLTTDFDKNKELVASYTDVDSKKTRNVIAGYVTRKMKSSEK